MEKGHANANVAQPASLVVSWKKDDSFFQTSIRLITSLKSNNPHNQPTNEAIQYETRLYNVQGGIGGIAVSEFLG